MGIFINNIFLLISEFDLTHINLVTYSYNVLSFIFSNITEFSEFYFLILYSPNKNFRFKHFNILETHVLRKYC